jgi:hypothetical protein
MLSDQRATNRQLCEVAGGTGSTTKLRVVNAPWPS